MSASERIVRARSVAISATVCIVRAGRAPDPQRAFFASLVFLHLTKLDASFDGLSARRAAGAPATGAESEGRSTRPAGAATDELAPPEPRASRQLPPRPRSLGPARGVSPIFGQWPLPEAMCKDAPVANG